MEEFATGMGPILFSKEFRGTVYCIKLFPIGGSCMMGEDEEATDSPNNFNNKSVWARMSVIVAGPVFNFILAFLFAVILMLMVGYDKPTIGAVEEGFPAAEAGMEVGDTLSGWEIRRSMFLEKWSIIISSIRERQQRLPTCMTGKRKL